MSAQSYHQSSHSGSSSPPESPSVLTPAQLSPRAIAVMAEPIDDPGRDPHPEGLDKQRPDDSYGLGLHTGNGAQTLDLSEELVHRGGNTGQTDVHRHVRSPRTGNNTAFTSSSEAIGAEYRGQGMRINTDLGFIEGAPPTPSDFGTPLSYIDKKLGSAYGDSPYGPSFPISAVNARVGNGASSTGERFQDSTVYWLGMYFFFNLGLTLFNKVVLVSFPFPYTLTGLHALSGCAGCYIALERGAFTPARLTEKENMVLAAFSVLYTINIAVSNISLQLVTVPFHQVVRAATPLFTIFITAVLLRQSVSAMKIVSLLPVIAGVGLATYGDYYFTAWGLILTVLGTFLAALKTVVTNLIQTGGGGRLKLHPLDLLMRMSPLAFVQCVFYSWYTGELERVRRYGATQMTRSKAVALLINGVIACGLNIVSFTANKKAGALTMTVSANCKQVITIALAVVLFNLHITPANGLGIILTLAGGGWYAYVEYKEKQRKQTGKLSGKAEKA